jgi:hypothetical protein
MHNRTMILALMVLVGGVMGVVVAGMHTPGAGGGKAVRKVSAGEGKKVSGGVPELPAVPMPGVVPAGAVVMPVMMEEPVGPAKAPGVPVAGVSNAVGGAPTEGRKSLIPGPDDAGVASSEGRQ